MKHALISSGIIRSQRCQQQDGEYQGFSFQGDRMYTADSRVVYCGVGNPLCQACEGDIFLPASYDIPSVPF